MTTNEYAQFVLQIKNGTLPSPSIDKATIYEAAQLLSGSFISCKRGRT